MASRKILLLPPNISSTKYFIPSSDQIYYGFYASKYLIFMAVAKLQVQRRCTNRLLIFFDMMSNRCEGLAWSQGLSQRIVCTTWSHTGQSTTHGMVTEASQRAWRIVSTNWPHQIVNYIWWWSQRLVKDAAQISKHSAGLVGSQAFVCLYLDLQCPGPPRPLAAIYPCCMLACLCSVIVFTPHLLLLLVLPRPGFGGKVYI